MVRVRQCVRSMRTVSAKMEGGLWNVAVAHNEGYCGAFGLWVVNYLSAGFCTKLGVFLRATALCLVSGFIGG